MVDNDVPQTEPSKGLKPAADASRNPDVGKRATPESMKSVAQPAARVRATTNTPGSKLVPDLTAHTIEQTREWMYWVGVTPSCPVESLDVGGINFPKLNEKLVKDPMRSGTRKRVPVIGALVSIDHRKVERILDRLPRTVLRFTGDDKGTREQDGTGKNLGDLHVRPRKGHPITIPTKAEVEERKRSGRATQAYVYREGDEPAARYMFAVLCEDQKNPARGEFYPPTLEDTGLEWPREPSEE